MFVLPKGAKVMARYCIWFEGFQWQMQIMQEAINAFNNEPA